MNQERIDNYTADCLNYISPLFARATEAVPFEMLCTILRVDGIQDKQWDAFTESRIAADQYLELLHDSLDNEKIEASVRLALLVYCQLTEMSDVHHMLFNVLKCCAGERYQIRPLQRLGKPKKGGGFRFRPPSANQKFDAIRNKAGEVGEQKLVELLNGFWDAELRNSFSHSDCIITADEYRITEGGLPRAIPISQVWDKIERCIAFYLAFFHCHVKFKQVFSGRWRYFKWPNYEVLELIRDKEEGVIGFHLHFSNNSKASFTRTANGVDAVNLSIEKGGMINFFVGEIARLEKQWKINGRIATDDDFAPLTGGEAIA